VHRSTVLQRRGRRCLCAFSQCHNRRLTLSTTSFASSRKLHYPSLRPYMKLPIFALLFSLAITVLAVSQQVPEQPTKFRSQTNLVLVPVQVRNHGQHMANLKQESFTILQDGKPQKIAVFEEVRTSTQRLQRAPVGPKEFTNELLGSPETARYTIIAIDRINTAPLDLMRVRQGLAQFLAHTSDTGEPIRLVSIELNGIRLLQDFTTDPHAIAAAMQRSTTGGKIEQSSVSLDESLQEVEAAVLSQSDRLSAEQVNTYLNGLDSAKDNEQRMLAFQERSARINSLEALQQIALSLAGLPGRKSLVWASSGFPFTSIYRQTRSSVGYDISQVSEATTLDAYTTQLLNTANIAMYPVDARGLTNTAFDAIDPGHKYSPTYAEKERRNLANQDVLTTFERLAAGTGGKPCYNRPVLQDCVKEALEDTRDYYMVGFYVNAKATKNGWHKLQIKVDEKGANVRSRNGFVSPLPDPGQNRELDMNTAVRSLLLDSGIPFRGQWTTSERKGNKISNSFVMQVIPSANMIDPEQKKIDLDFVGIARSKD